MRPDEHKKKRSAQYKKKHGDKVDKTKATKQTSTQKTPGQKFASDESSPSLGRTDSDNGTGRVVAAGRESPRSSATRGEKESEQFDDWEQQNSFRRRQVISNWERYEGTASLTEDAPTLRGADFKDIVEAGGDAFSQFRFRDEQLWEAGDELEAGSEDTPKYLTIDCEQLAVDLLCLPLYERLGVDKATFQEDHIVLFDEQAKTNQGAKEERKPEASRGTFPETCCSWDDTVHAPSPDSSLVTDRCREPSESEDILDDILQLTDMSQLVESIAPDCDYREEEARPNQWDNDNIGRDTLTPSDERHKPSDDRTNATNSVSIQKTVNVPSAVTTEPEHSKLASVTDMMSQKNSTESKVLTDSDIPQESVSGIEDDLDFLLTLEVPVSKEEKSTQPTDTSDAGQNVSLDDWLDDMIAS